MNFLKNASKQQKGIVQKYVISLGRKTVLKKYFFPFYWFDQHQLFKQIHIFLRIFTFSNMVRKTNFLSISVLVSEIVTFLINKRSSLGISPKMLQINRKAQYSSMWLTFQKKQFLLIFIPFYWFDQKQLFKHILIFLRIFPFLTW